MQLCRTRVFTSGAVALSLLGVCAASCGAIGPATRTGTGGGGQDSAVAVTAAQGDGARTPGVLSFRETAVDRSYRHRYALARELVHVGEYRAAERLLRELRRESPGNALVALTLARVAAIRGNLHATVAEYRAAISAMSRHSRADAEVQLYIELIEALLSSAGSSSDASTGPEPPMIRG